MQPLISICVPSIRPEKWLGLYQSICRSIGSFSFEIIFVGPCEPPSEVSNLSNLKFISDYGNPTRCTQIGAIHSLGRLFTWVSDDGLYLDHTLSDCITQFLQQDEKDEMSIMYGEGNGFHLKPYFGNHPPAYWNAWYHDMKNTSIPSHYKLAMLGLLHLNYFIELGGFDCRYEHINFSTHDLAFRIQNNGGNINLSPCHAIAFDCPPENERLDYKAVRDAYILNDFPIFKRENMNKFDHGRVYIDFDNWKSAPDRWRRFT